MRGAPPYPRMEITSDGLMLGAGTVLAGMVRDERGRPRLALDDEQRALALLATAYERPVDAAAFLPSCAGPAELWNEGEKALAHIHLAHAGVPPCGEVQALRLFVADELLAAGVDAADADEGARFRSRAARLIESQFQSGAAAMGRGQWARQRTVVGRRER